MPAVVVLMKASYCNGDKTKCARYQVALAGIEVPGDLFPSETDKAREIVDGH